MTPQTSTAVFFNCHCGRGGHAQGRPGVGDGALNGLERDNIEATTPAAQPFHPSRKFRTDGPMQVLHVYSGSMPGIHEDAKYRYERLRNLLLADTPPPARIIELGSAPGDQIAALASLGYEATSVDIGVASDSWADADEGRMATLLASAHVRHIEWDIETIPYPLEDESFDAVIMTEVYEHLREYPVRALAESRRILAPGGRLYFTTPNAAYLMNRLRLLRGRSVATPLADWIGGLPHARHAREYTFAEIDALMSHVGLRVLKREARHFQANSGQTSAHARLGKFGLDAIGRVVPTLGATIVVVASRP